MSLIKSNVLITFLLIIVAIFGLALGGTVYKVGDSSGWIMTGVDYDGWAYSKTFQVGDSLVFEYNNLYHDVAEVNHSDFELCDSSKPLRMYQTGSDTVRLTKPGLHHFICGVPGHCMVGQKLQVYVFQASLGPVAGPVPRPVRSPGSSSFASPAKAPLPLQNTAMSTSWIGFSLLALILAI